MATTINKPRNATQRNIQLRNVHNAADEYAKRINAEKLGVDEVGKFQSGQYRARFLVGGRVWKVRFNGQGDSHV